MSDLRDKVRDIAEDIYFEGHDLGKSYTHEGGTDLDVWADRIIEIMRGALLTEDTLKEMVLNLNIKTLADGKTQVDAAAGMHAALDTAGATRRKQTIEDFIEGR